MEKKIYHLHTISGLHVGTGQGIGVIDMPIARERATNLPQVPGSGIKGVLRDECQADENNKEHILALFGPEAGDKASEFAGALAVGDARLLCLPIRSWRGTFSWVTCPMVLERYKRDLQDNKITGFPESRVSFDDDPQCKHTTDSALLEGNKIYLEDLDLNTEAGADEWANFIAPRIFTDDDWQTLFKQRFPDS